MKKFKLKKKQKPKQKVNKTRNLIAYIVGKNHQIKEFHTDATRKFNINDETYVIKGNCCYFKEINGQLEQIAFYIEGNPNPFDMKTLQKNTGLTSDELENYIGGDIFNILIECQSEDRSKYIIQLVVVVFVLALIQFAMTFFGM